MPGSKTARILVITATCGALAISGGSLPGNAAPATASGAQFSNSPPGLRNLTDRPQRRKPRQLTVMLELDTPASATVYRSAAAKAGRTAARNASRSAIANTQQRTTATLAALGAAVPKARVVFRAARLYSGVAVSVPENDISKLRALPGVRQVRVMPLKYRTNATLNPLIRAPQAWQLGAAGTGANTRIGIIDSGIDYTHATFGGAGTAAAYTAAKQSNSFTPTAKVVAGWDFAGDNYDPGNPERATPQPDANPLDCDGHGTHVAGTAAGYGVTSAGQRFGTGQVSDYSGAAADPTSWLSQFGSPATVGVGPGVAPLAKLYALRIFGCTGGSGLIIPALEAAADPNGDGDLADHLDIVNMSLGGDFGSGQDPDAIAVNNAVSAGITVIASAGNAGDVADASSSPGNATKALSVAASDTQDVLADFSARGRRTGTAVKPDVAAPGVDTYSAANGTGYGSRRESGTSMAAPVVSGQAAIIKSLRPEWSPEEIKAAIVNSAGQDVRQVPGGNFAGPTSVGSGRVNVAASAVADTLVYNVTDPGAVSISFGEIAARSDSSTSKTVRVVNKSLFSQTYSVELRSLAEVPGVTYTTSLDAVGRRLTLAPNSSADFQLELSINRLALRHSGAALAKTSYPLNLTGTPIVTERQYPSEALARVEVTQESLASPRVLRLPVAASVRPASALSTMDFVPGRLETYTPGSTGIANRTLTGLGLANGVGTAEGVQSRGQGFALAAVSSAQPPCPATTTSCLPYPDAGAADLRSVGVTSNAKPLKSPSVLAYDPATESLTTFAITTWKPWATAEGFMKFEVFIDANRNGTADFVLYNTRTWYDEDIFVAQLDAIYPDGERVPIDIEPLNGVHKSGNALGFGGPRIPTQDTDTLTLPFFTSLLGKVTGTVPGSRFNYWVKSETLAQDATDSVASSSAPLTFDALRPAIRVAPYGGIGIAGDSTFPETPGGSLTFTRDAASYVYDRTQGEMLVHFHNIHGYRTEITRMRQQQSLIIPTALSATRDQAAGSFLPGVSASSGLAVTVAAGPSSVCLVSSGRIYPRASGRCTVTLSQAGNTAYAPAATTTRTFTVRGSTSAGLTISDSTLTTTQSAIVTARVARTTAAAASLAGGTVRFYDGSRLLASRSLGSSGTAAIYLPTRSRGTHYLRVMYLGSSWYSPSTSGWLRISVR